MIVFKRGKGKILSDYGFGEIYTFYKERYKDKALPKKTLKEIYKRLFPEIVKLMIFEALDYRLPSHLGYIRVKKKLSEPKINENGELDTRTLSINYKKTMRLWDSLYPGKTAEEIKKIPNKPVIRELNEHIDGYRLMWYWDKTTSTMKNQTAYFINMTRDNDRLLSGAVKTNNLNYYE
jgi:hypothetical protein